MDLNKTTQNEVMTGNNYACNSCLQKQLKYDIIYKAQENNDDLERLGVLFYAVLCLFSMRNRKPFFHVFRSYGTLHIILTITSNNLNLIHNYTFIFFLT